MSLEFERSLSKRAGIPAESIDRAKVSSKGKELASGPWECTKANSSFLGCFQAASLIANGAKAILGSTPLSTSTASTTYTVVNRTAVDTPFSRDNENTLPFRSSCGISVDTFHVFLYNSLSLSVLTVSHLARLSRVRLSPVLGAC